MLILGIIIGILISTLIFIILAFFRAGIEKRFKIIETVLAKAGPAPKGYVFEPNSDEDEIRNDIIKNNRKLGKDTPISDLM